MLDAVLDGRVDERDCLLLLWLLAHRGDDEERVDGALGMGIEDGLGVGRVALDQLDDPLARIDEALGRRAGGVASKSEDLQGGGVEVAVVEEGADYGAALLAGRAGDEDSSKSHCDGWVEIVLFWLSMMVFGLFDGSHKKE